MKSKYLTVKIIYILLTALICIQCSCKKFVEPLRPNDQLNSDLVFTDSSTAVAAITGIYSDMFTNINLFSNAATTVYAGMTADELYYFTPDLRDEFVKNQITQANHINLNNSFWQPAYKSIYAANLAIEKLSGSQTLSVSLRSRLVGEAKFIRAFCYFHLVNLFGDVPLITITNYVQTSVAGRSPVSEVYNQIVADLDEAKQLLSNQYVSGEKVRPNKWTATALLARVYLYLGEWAKAETEAGLIIASGEYNLEPDLSKVFLANSAEAIWQLMPVRPGYNTYEALAILPANSFSFPTYLLTTSLLNAFEEGDARRTNWVGSRIYSGDSLHYPFKYKVFSGASITEYYMVFRLAEQYLIRAEAAVHQNKVSEAVSDINIIRARAGLPNTTAADMPSILTAIQQERRIEFFSEWGHRWYDLKRTGKADAVLGPLKGSTWQPTDVLWPIPQQQLNLNSALSQNPGYN